MEFAFKYEMWELIGHEQFPETHVLATPLTGNAFNGKKILHIRYQQVISDFPDFWRSVSHRFNGKCTLTCVTHRFSKPKKLKLVVST